MGNLRILTIDGGSRIVVFHSSQPDADAETRLREPPRSSNLPPPPIAPKPKLVIPRPARVPRPVV